MRIIELTLKNRDM